MSEVDLEFDEGPRPTGFNYHLILFNSAVSPLWAHPRLHIIFALSAEQAKIISRRPRRVRGDSQSWPPSHQSGGTVWQFSVLRKSSTTFPSDTANPRTPKPAEA
jgi:hypothetical protein